MVDHDDDDAGCWADFIGRARHIFEKGRWLIRVYGKPPLIWASANIHHLNNMRVVRMDIVLMTMRTHVEFDCF